MFINELGIPPILSPTAGLDRIQGCYNDNWTCPIPPKENRIAVRIEAGEKNFKTPSMDKMELLC